MKIYLVTDLEAVAGVLDSLAWCYPGSRYFDLARELLTREVNAAIEGFFAAGAKQIVVCDGHGCGGIQPQLLHPDVELIAGSFSHTPCPYGLDESFDALAWVGQHAMAGAPFNHLAHTGSFRVLELAFNGRPIGEIGQFAFCAAELRVRPIFLSGDRAGCEEARALIPGIETVSVKEGLSPLQGRELTAEQAELAFTAARHLSPEAARLQIRRKAEGAVRRARADPEMGRLHLPAPPYTLRSTSRQTGEGQPGSVSFRSHPHSFIGAMNAKPAPGAVVGGRRPEGKDR